jgi:hypothetical protein
VTEFLQGLAVMLVALEWAMATAHALELPGKLRLDRDAYFAAQGIYYPGFTIAGGIAGPGGILALLILLFVTPTARSGTWLLVLALLGMIAVQAVYWIRIHGVNKYWMKGRPIGAAGEGFFKAGPTEETPAASWTELRDRWEKAHAARAALATVSLVSLVAWLIVSPGA